MSALTTPTSYRALATVMAGGAIADAVQADFVVKSLDTVGFPQRYRWIFAPIKAAAAIGLLSVATSPGLARLTTAMLTLYFVLAVGAHVRVKDSVANTVPAAALLATFALMTAEGPARDR